MLMIAPQRQELAPQGLKIGEKLLWKKRRNLLIRFLSIIQKIFKLDSKNLLKLNNNCTYIEQTNISLDGPILQRYYHWGNIS